jgi:hypothetical protein
MKPIYPVLTLAAVLVSFSSVTMAADSVLQDNSVDSKFSADNAAQVDTSQIKPGHKKPGLGDGMITKQHKHGAAPKAAPLTPAGPQPGAPPLKDVVGKHDDSGK